MAKKLVIDTASAEAGIRVVDVATPLTATEEEVHSSNKDIPVGQAANSFVVVVKAQHIGTALPTSNTVGGVVIGLNEDIYFQDTANDVNSGIYEAKSLAPLTWGRAEYSLHPAFRENYKIMLVGHGSGPKGYKLPYIPGYVGTVGFGAIKVADLGTEEEQKSLISDYIIKGTLNKYKGVAANDTELLSLSLTAGNKIILSPLYVGNLEDPFKGRGVTYNGKDSPTLVNFGDYKNTELTTGEIIYLGNGNVKYQYQDPTHPPLKISEIASDGTETIYNPLIYTKTSKFQQGTEYSVTPAADVPALKTKAQTEGTSITLLTESGGMATINSLGLMSSQDDSTVVLTDTGEEAAPPAPAFSNTRSIKFANDRLLLSSSIPMGTTYTASAWFKSTTSPSGVILGGNLSGADAGYMFYITGSKLYHNPGTGYSSGNFPFAANTWYHLVVARTGGLVKLYVNENLIGSGSISATTTFSFNSIAAYYNGGYPFIGLIDEVALFLGTELTPAQILAMYNSGTPNDLSTNASLSHWWQIGDGLTVPVGNFLAPTDLILDKKGTVNAIPTSFPELSSDVPSI